MPGGKAPNKYEALRKAGLDEATIAKVKDVDTIDTLRSATVSALNRLNEDPESMERAEALCNAIAAHSKARNSAITLTVALAVAKGKAK